MFHHQIIDLFFHYDICNGKLNNVLLSFKIITLVYQLNLYITPLTRVFELSLNSH